MAYFHIGQGGTITIQREAVVETASITSRRQRQGHDLPSAVERDLHAFSDKLKALRQLQNLPNSAEPFQAGETRLHQTTDCFTYRTRIQPEVSRHS